MCIGLWLNNRLTTVTSSVGPRKKTKSWYISWCHQALAVWGEHFLSVLRVSMRGGTRVHSSHSDTRRSHKLLERGLWWASVAPFLFISNMNLQNSFLFYIYFWGATLHLQRTDNNLGVWFLLHLTCLGDLPRLSDPAASSFTTAPSHQSPWQLCTQCVRRGCLFIG